MKYYFSFTDISLNPFSIHFLTLRISGADWRGKKKFLKKKTKTKTTRSYLQNMQSVSFKWVLWQNWLKVIQSSDRVYLYFCTCKSFPLLSGRNTFSGRGLWNGIQCKDRKQRSLQILYISSCWDNISESWGYL